MGKFFLSPNGHHARGRGGDDGESITMRLFEFEEMIRKAPELYKEMVWVADQQKGVVEESAETRESQRSE